ncbi:MAG: hypothetical protein ACLRFE_02960 [Clostridia bacterium]
MKINEFDYCFKMRDDKDISIDIGSIYKNLGYNNCDKEKIAKIYNLSYEDINNDNYLIDINIKVGEINNCIKDNINEKCKSLQNMWDNYRNKYYSIISKILDINIVKDITEYRYCYIQLLPINEVALMDKCIYLIYSEDVNEMFKNFIILLTKLILVNKWKTDNNWVFETEFDAKNKIWMFAELSIDAIFNYSELKSITSSPTYPHFYNLIIDDVNIINLFRDMFCRCEINQFLTNVYTYVHNNYLKISKFKHYLY